MSSELDDLGPLDAAIAAVARGAQDIDLYGADIGDVGAVGIAVALKLNPKITSVNLSCECRA